MLPLRERGTSHPRSVVLGIARQQASAKVSICSMTGPRLVARDRWFESISLLQRVYCELRSRRMKKCRVLDAARKRGWRTEPAREPLPPQNEPP
jgi:hypothetical protein